MQVGATGSAAYALNPLQIQQAAAPIAETGGNDLQSPPTQRVEQSASTDASQQASPPSGSGRGQIIDIYA